MQPLRALPLLLALALTASPARPRPPEDWEPVTAAELALAESRIEPGTGAEAIFWKIWVQHELQADGRVRQTRDSYVRVKIFTAAGAQRCAVLDIDYPLHGVSVRDIRARTVQPDGSVLLLERQAIRKEVLVRVKGEGLRRQSFAPPGVKPGSVVEYRYREVLYGGTAIAYELQLDVPIQRLSYFVKPLDIAGWNLRWMGFGTTARMSDSPVDGYYETTVTDQPPYRREPFSPPEHQQRPWLLQYYTREKLTSPERFWSDFARRQADEYEGATRPTRESRALAAGIVAGDTTRQGRLRRLGEWVQREFVVCDDDPDTLSARGLGETRQVRDLLRGRVGTHSDAMLVFGTLARSVDIDARLLRVGSSGERFFNQGMMDGAFLPTFEIGVRDGSFWRAYDPATRSLPWDMLPWDQEGELALLCADSACFVENPLAPPARSRLTTTGTLRLAEDGTVEGDVAMSFSGHLKEAVRAALDIPAASEDDSIPLEQAYWLPGGHQRSRIQWLAGTDGRQPVEYRYHVRLEGFATRTARRIVLEPAALRGHAESPFTASERRAPVWFSFAWSERDSLVVELPAGWKPETVAAPEPFESDGIGYQSGCQVSADGRSVLYVRSLHVGDQSSTWFPVARYPTVQQLFDRIRQLDRSTITLVRETRER